MTRAVASSKRSGGHRVNHRGYVHKFRLEAHEMAGVTSPLTDRHPERQIGQMLVRFTAIVFLITVAVLAAIST